MDSGTLSKHRACFGRYSSFRFYARIQPARRLVVGVISFHPQDPLLCFAPPPHSDRNIALPQISSSNQDSREGVRLYNTTRTSDFILSSFLLFHRAHPGTCRSSTSSSSSSLPQLTTSRLSPTYDIRLLASSFPRSPTRPNRTSTLASSPRIDPLCRHLPTRPRFSDRTLARLFRIRSTSRLLGAGAWEGARERKVSVCVARAEVRRAWTVRFS